MPGIDFTAISTRRNVKGKFGGETASISCSFSFFPRRISSVRSVWAAGKKSGRVFQDYRLTTRASSTLSPVVQVQTPWEATWPTPRNFRASLSSCLAGINSGNILFCCSQTTKRLYQVSICKSYVAVSIAVERQVYFLWKKRRSESFNLRRLKCSQKLEFVRNNDNGIILTKINANKLSCKHNYSFVRFDGFKIIFYAATVN